MKGIRRSLVRPASPSGSQVSGPLPSRGRPCRTREALLLTVSVVIFSLAFGTALFVWFRL